MVFDFYYSQNYSQRKPSRFDLPAHGSHAQKAGACPAGLRRSTSASLSCGCYGCATKGGWRSYCVSTGHRQDPREAAAEEGSGDPQPVRVRAARVGFAWAWAPRAAVQLKMPSTLQHHCASRLLRSDGVVLRGGVREPEFALSLPCPCLSRALPLSAGS